MLKFSKPTPTQISTKISKITNKSFIFSLLIFDMYLRARKIITIPAIDPLDVINKDRGNIDSIKDFLLSNLK